MGLCLGTKFEIQLFPDFCEVLLFRILSKTVRICRAGSELKSRIRPGLFLSLCLCDFPGTFNVVQVLLVEVFVDIPPVA